METAQKWGRAPVVLLATGLVALVLSSCQKDEKQGAEEAGGAKPGLAISASPQQAKDAASIQIDSSAAGESEFDAGIHPLDSLEANDVPSDTSQVMVVDKKCAMNISMDSMEAEVEMARQGEESWNEVVSDNNHYTFQVVQSLEAHDVPVLDASRKKRFIRFVYPDQSTFVIDLTKGRDLWGLLLFDGKNRPVYWLSTGLSSEWKRRMFAP
ncbi:MAG: hypothetical protein IPK50_09580 [Fibrobacterota bacterium]|nr:hypothetical protein [Fibrobacterota bacterium]QQS07129.1 MAG: hypothetical protein IPK50_09580 [Fibrobacterota bacterium]